MTHWLAAVFAVLILFVVVYFTARACFLLLLYADHVRDAMAAGLAVEISLRIAKRSTGVEANFESFNFVWNGKVAIATKVIVQVTSHIQTGYPGMSDEVAAASEAQQPAGNADGVMTLLTLTLSLPLPF